MKMTKRILAILLLAALLVSCLLLSVSAEDPFSADGISSIEGIMEYYDLDDYLADNYEDGTYNTGLYVGGNSVVVADPTDESNKVLKVTGKNNKYANASATDALVVSFDIYYDVNMKGEYRLDVKTLDAVNAESLTYNTIFSVNGGNNVFQYSVWDANLNNGDGAFVLTDFEAIAPLADTWYNVVVFFNAKDGYFNFKISSDEKQTWVYSENYSLGNAVEMTCFELKSYAKSRSDTVSFYLDNVEVYCGTFERNPANKNAITAQTLIDLETLYLAEDTDSATKVRIAEVLDRLVNGYSYTPAEGTAEIERVQSIIDNTPKYINLAFAEEVVVRAAAIDTEAGYYQRLDFVEESKYYSGSIPDDDQLATAPGLADAPELVEATIAARASFTAEEEALAKVAEHSTAFVLKMKSYDSLSKNYDGYLKSFYEEVTKYTDRDVTYTAAVEGANGFTMEEATALFEELDAKYTKLVDSAKKFIDGATSMKEALELMQVAIDAKQKMNAALEIMKGIDLEDENLDEEQRAIYEEQKAIYDEQKAIYDAELAKIDSEDNEIIFEKSFAKLAAGYELAASVYNNGDIDENLDETTYEELYELFSVFNGSVDFIVEQIEASVRFLDIMKKAKTATYYTAIVQHLDDAKEAIGEARIKYAGVPEAILLYTALTTAIQDSETASEAYIKAVAAISDDMKFDVKQATIEAAYILKAEGDNLGIEGVKEANQALSEYMTNVETLIANSAKFISFMEELKTVDDFAKRRELLAKAEQIANSCEVSIEGVADALEAFEGYCEEYKVAIQAMNAAHTSAVANAADVAGSAASDAGVYKAADVIKNYIG